MEKESLPKSFEELITTNDKPVLVDFYAEWCAPCRMVSPSIGRIAGELKDRITTIKIDVDKKQEIAMRYQIQSIPTIMLFYRGKSLMRLQGALPYEALRTQIRQHLPAQQQEG